MQKTFLTLYKMKIKLFILFILTASLSLAQTEKVDSLKQLVVHTNDTAKSKLYGELFWEYCMINNVDSGFYYAKKELDYSKKIGWKKGIGQGYNDIGITYQFKVVFDSSLVYYDSSLAIRQEIKDQKGIGSLYNKIGIILYKQGKYKEFLALQLKARKLYESIKDTVHLATTINNISQAFSVLENYEKSLEILNEALSLYKAIGDENKASGTLVNIGNCYKALGDTIKALEYYESAIPTMEKFNNYEYLGRVYHNIANYYINKDINKSYENILKAIENKKQSAFGYDYTISLTIAGDIARKLKKYEEAKNYLFTALSYVEENNIGDELNPLYNNLASYYHSIGKYDSAYYYQKKCSDVKTIC